MEILLCHSPRFATVGANILRALQTKGHHVRPWHTKEAPPALTGRSALPHHYHPDLAIFIAAPEELAFLTGPHVANAGTNLPLELGVVLGRIGAERIAAVHVHPGPSPGDRSHHVRGVENLDCAKANIATIRNGLIKWIDERGKFASLDGIQRRMHDLQSRIRKKPLTWLPYVDAHVIGPFASQIDRFEIGEIALDYASYFAAIIGETQRAGRESSITAIASLSHEFWQESNDQQRYFDKSVEAAERGAKVKRVFIVFSPDGRAFFTALAGRMATPDVSIRLANSTFYRKDNIPEDIVVFNDADGSRRAYVIIPGDESRTVLREAKLILRDTQIDQYMTQFDTAWEIGDRP